MFQFAFGYALSRKYKTIFAIDYNKQLGDDSLFYFNLTTKSFRQQCSVFLYFLERRLPTRVFRIIAFTLLRVINGKIKVESISMDDWIKPEQNLWKISDGAYYVGHFQSTKYFLEYSDEIKKLFKIKTKYREEFENKYGEIFIKNKTIAIHLRKTDFSEHGSDLLGGSNLTLPVSYYKEVFSRIDNINQYKILFVSDDIESVKKEFGEQNNYIFSKESMIIDFQILLNSDIAIIANSTFSWWAAFLNNKSGKVIYAPKYWLGFKVKNEFPVGILDMDCIKIEI
jgi:hypothetical protein